MLKQLKVLLVNNLRLSTQIKCDANFGKLNLTQRYQVNFKRKNICFSQPVALFLAL